MPDTSDWKQKYRDSLLDMESEENRWRQVEKVLRRLIGRLCAAGMGMDPRLDAELSGVAAANRRNADAEELERLAASLTTAVICVDAAAPVGRPESPFAGRWNSTCSAVAALLQRLKAQDADAAKARTLLAEVARINTDAELAALVGRVAELVHERGEAISRERVRAAAVLSEVTRRLEEMSGFLAESDSASRNRFEDTQSFNDDVMAHVRQLSSEVDAATELGMLQVLVNERLQSVARQLGAFRSREQNRMLESSGRADRMRSRIADLERETVELHSKLDREQQAARLDPLTGVANRRSFDERLTREIARCRRGAAPLALLLWDIDDFKIINDSYGHRAGDRVLRSVADCLKAAIRATDFVARIGGEEFVVLLNGLGVADACLAADEVRTAVEGLRFHFRGTPVRVTVSCGLTELAKGDAGETAFDRADAALYRAKHGGKNLCIAA